MSVCLSDRPWREDAEKYHDQGVLRCPAGNYNHLKHTAETMQQIGEENGRLEPTLCPTEKHIPISIKSESLLLVHLLNTPYPNSKFHQ